MGPGGAVCGAAGPPPPGAVGGVWVGVESGDLYDAGHLTLLSAVDSFAPDAGRPFISWLALKLKGAFAEAGGYRSHKQSLDPLHRAGSLDEPMGEDEDSFTLGGLIPDPKAEATILAVEAREQLSQLSVALEWALSTLPVQQRDTLRRRYYQEMTIAEIAAAEGVSRQTVYLWHNKGLRALRHPRTASKLRACQ